MGVVLMAASAQAGGFSRGTADTDILYEDGNFNFRAGATIVMPGHEFTADPVMQAPGTSVVGSDYLDTYMIPSAAVKFKITDNLSCAGTFTTPYGAASSYSAPYGPKGTVEETFTVAEFGGTCAAFVEMGRGRLSVLGGGFIERFSYDLASNPIVPPFSGAPLAMELTSNAYGWRAGLGYEIPDIALRAQVMYRSATSHDASGFATSPLFEALGAPGGILPATGSGELPQSVEFKLQTGIAPGWLAFGSVKWTDWSVNEQLIVSAGPVDSANLYHWKDGWTITGGVGHAFNERVSGVVSLQWDQGVSTGYDYRSEKWMLASGVSLKDDLGGELRLGGALVYLTSAEITGAGAPDFGAAVDNGWAGILSASYKVKW
ncbi:OmpP1/FadL family transporter [Chelativorans xinjiangense]|uniref:OmpP1/FadL family transporter n=1 Tax=Chelativorans xinjiangense TaxID=2681485 RepID=UPI001FE41D19|nr:outer membrane protein transport protein [Chelativorans xinjiangense]